MSYVVFTFSQSLNPWSLQPPHFLPIKQFIYFLSQPVDLCPILSLTILYSYIIKDLSLFLNLFRNSPKDPLLHFVKALAQCLSPVVSPLEVFRFEQSFQASSMTSIQLALLVHMASKWNIRFLWHLMELALVKSRGQWSDVGSTRWYTLIFWKCSNHSIVAKAWSCLK